jgi:tripartite-type tricarboxylate transporter receptor subunit TctC
MKSAPSTRVRLGCAALLLIATAAVPLLSTAQEYPVRPIRMIVGFAPGGVADLLARGLAQKLTEAWGQQVIVDNRAGAGGVIGMQLAAKSAPDGYTLLMGSSTQFSINPALRTVPYDPIRDYEPILHAALTPVILTVHPGLPAKSISDLTKIAKTRTMSYGSTGFGGAPHISAELLKRVSGIDMTHIPYKGGSEAVTALLGGHVQASFGAVSTSLPHLRSGKLHALGVTSAKRLAAIPNVPTFIEGGLAGFEVEQWFGVFAPAGVPPAIKSRLSDALAQAASTSQLREHFSSQGVELQASTPQAFAGYVKSELARWRKLLQELGIRETS